MESAFGVDHGEISKGVTWASWGRKAGTAAGTVAGHGKRIADKSISVSGIGDSTGAAAQWTGKKISGTGSALRRHPSLTGSTVVGAGGTAGVLAYRKDKKGSKKPKKHPEAM